MKKILFAMAVLLVVPAVQARIWTTDEVKDIIRKVNTYWQNNNPAEVHSFWDNAVYHTGNIEVYKLLQDQKMLDYSIRWAEHNQWKGATEDDPTKWKYKNYGEGQDYVLFGDWQICFQTYIDLYHIDHDKDQSKIARALEVMGYETDSKAHDYWWWADALYMVMPVMTKMYKLTGEEKYLQKLYENILYSDSIMLDSETDLYFRDGKYVYPKHKTASGKKDFWARGDGWVLAGLAKVLQDMPTDYVHQPFFVEKYVKLACAVAKIQQPQGYWTRSMLDPEQAPGYETSGTAFFCYGLLWGVNNGYLSKKEFAPTIEKAWKYLTEIALQKDGKVGYVQPIGERAIPGQTVDANSQANFGVGAFLLAACEYVRYLEAAVSLENAFPRADNPFWRDSIPIDMRQSYVRYGEQYLGKSWEALPMTLFSEFKTNGNRVNYESQNFAKRKHLAALVMAEIMEGEGRFMGDIINGLGSFCEETWWGIPAHYSSKIPLPKDQTVDLFNAETANLIVWSAYMLRPQLDKFAPQLSQRIASEIQRRILEPALQNNYWWKTAGMNWNPWICSNWLACVLICEDNPQRKETAIQQIVAASNAFIDAYPEDGGCDEGPGYWDRATASLFEVLRLLQLDEVGKEASASLMEKLPKIRAMASYVYKTYIGNDYCVNFADTHGNRTLQQVNIVYPFGLWLGDQTMREFAAYLGKQKNILTTPAPIYNKSGNFPTLSRELFFLRHINEFVKEQPREPQLKDVWLNDLQIMIARRDMFAAIKGGTNGESHNHNDVGSFIVYADNMPLLIDVGVGEYTSKTFSNNRYDIWTMQSGYHNLPQINGIDEKNGKDYQAQVVSHKNGQLCLDIAGAYPKEASVKSWKRTLSSGKSAITITEDYELETYCQPSKLMFITPVKPVVNTQRGMLSLGNRQLKYDSRQVEPSVEDISELLDPLLQGIWGGQMYRIVLTIKSDKQKEQIKYTIQ